MAAKKSANRQVLDKYLGRKVSVPLGDGDDRLELKRPSRAQLVAIREYALENNEKKEVKEGDPISGETLNATIEMVERVVALCVPDLRESEAFDLIMEAGGEQSELVQECFLLCGLRPEEAAEIADADPTPSLSPAPLDGASKES